MGSHRDDYASSGSSGFRSLGGQGSFPGVGSSQFSSFFIDDILGQEGRPGKTPPSGGHPRPPPRPQPLYPPATSSPIPSPPTSPMDTTGGWPASCLPSGVSQDALALDGGGLLGDFRLLPPPFALFHQNVVVPSTPLPHRDCRLLHHHHQHGGQHHLPEAQGGTFSSIQAPGGAKTYLEAFSDASAKGNFERWTPLHCHLMALRQSRASFGTSGGGRGVMGICPSKRKGGQVRFSPEQTTTLERRFGGHKYLSPEERRILAQDLKLTDRQVKTWFQNRRAKWRRASQTSSLASPTGGVDCRSVEGLGSLPDGVHSSKNSTSSSSKGLESKGEEGESDVEDEVFHEELQIAVG